MNHKPRVVITGIGVVSSIGIGKENFWRGLENAKSGIKQISLFDTSECRSKLGGEVSDFCPEGILGEKGLRNLDRTTKLALSATRLALDDSKFEINQNNTNVIGVAFATTMGSVWSISEFDKQSLREGPRSVNPALFANTVINSPASQISIRFGIKGFNTTIATGFSASLDALDYACNFIRWGRAKMVIVSSAEELCEQTFKGFYKTGFLAGSKTTGDEINCPFDKRRNGILLGEGSVTLVVEDYDHAVNRNANIYGEIVGHGSSFDLKNINRYNLRTQSAWLSMESTLQDAEISPDDVDCVLSSANSTIDGDMVEARAINSVFKSTTLPVTAIKSMIGETFSASGAFQIGAALFVLNTDLIPPSINFSEKDERCSIGYLVDRTKKIEPATNVLLNSFGPTGQNASLLLRKRRF